MAHMWLCTFVCMLLLADQEQGNCTSFFFSYKRALGNVAPSLSVCQKPHVSYRFEFVNEDVAKLGGG